MTRLDNPFDDKPVLPHQEDEQAEVALRSFEVKCPGCGNIMHNRTQVCKNCGRPTGVKTKPVERPKQEFLTTSATVAKPAQPKPPKPPETYVMMAKFSVQLGATMSTFAPGTIVTDMRLIAALKQVKAPMVIASESKSMVCCPHCQGLFVPETLKVKAA